MIYYLTISITTNYTSCNLVPVAVYLEGNYYANDHLPSLDLVMLHVQLVSRLLSLAKTGNKLYLLSNKAISVPIWHAIICIANVIIYALHAVKSFIGFISLHLYYAAKDVHFIDGT